MIMSGKDDSHQKVLSKSEDDKRAIEHSDHSENTQRTLREYTENNQTTLREHSPTPLETRATYRYFSTYLSVKAKLFRCQLFFSFFKTFP